MKKLLTFLFALMMISSLSFGNGSMWLWTGAATFGGSPTDWTNSGNWAAPQALPYGEPVGIIPIWGPAGDYPGSIPANTGDFPVFNDGGLDIVTNVPNVTLGRFEVTYFPGSTQPTNVYLSGAFDGATITMRGPSAQIIAEGTLWIVSVGEASLLNCNQTFYPNRVKLVMKPGAHFWQKDAATFDPADFSNGGTFCPTVNYVGNKGFVLEAVPGNHAEFIQQKNTSQAVKGYLQVCLDDNNYHFVCPPITSQSILSAINPILWPLGEFTSPNDWCRKPNSLCIFDGDWVRKFSNGALWNNWLGAVGGCFNPVVDIETGRGYEVYGNPLNSLNTTGNYEFYGTFNSQDPLNSPPGFPTFGVNPLGNFELTLPVTAPGWNFIGNPFASAIIFAEPSGQQTAGVGWVWDLGKTDPWVYWYDNTLAGYRIYNWFTGVGTGSMPAKREIPRSQGFFVHVTTFQPGAPHIPSGSDIAVGNQARVFRGNRGIEKSVIANIMNVSLKDESGKTVDEAIINFRDDGNGTEFNRILDAYKFFNEITNPSQLYFKTSDNVEAAIKTLKLATGNVMYPLYMRVTSTGTYTLDVKEISTFSPNTGILLKDNKTNTTVDLKVNPVYTFTATAGDDNDRFGLYFTDVLYGINNLTGNTLKVYSYDKSIYIQNNDPKTTAGTVLVYDMIGKQIIQENLNSSITRINTNLNKGFYIVSVKTDKGLYNQKIYIN
jgi:hypothetical protein